MLSPYNLFNNFFADENISDKRLFDFADATLKRFVFNNEAHDFNALVWHLSTQIEDFYDEISEYAPDFRQRRSFPLNVDAFIKEFSRAMNAEERFIARATIDKGADAYFEFYPNGVGEYSNATEATMPLLTDRLYVATTEYAAQLGETLTAILLGFVTDWRDHCDAKGTADIVDTRNNEPRGNRKTLELALLEAIHAVGSKFPGDTDKCLSFFGDFDLLLEETED